MRQVTVHEASKECFTTVTNHQLASSLFYGHKPLICVFAGKDPLVPKIAELPFSTFFLIPCYKIMPSVVKKKGGEGPDTI